MLWSKLTLKICARLEADITGGVKISWPRKSPCAGHRTHLIHGRPWCHRQSLPLLTIVPRIVVYYHVVVGCGGQPITASRPYSIERHGRWTLVTHLLNVVSSSSPKFVAPMAGLYKLSTPSLCLFVTIPSLFQLAPLVHHSLQSPESPENGHQDHREASCRG
jgi:hypothetical protein